MAMPDKQSSAAGRRKAAFSDFRRELIREAARQVFVEVGLTKASVREIAKAGGFTTGAIYAQYASKEEVYAEILRESLGQLADEVKHAADSASAGMRASATLHAWFAYYSKRPAEFDLGFYLASGAQATGVGKQLNRDLNERLRRVYAVVADAMEADGLVSSTDKHTKSVAAVSSIFGILLMAQTGRLKILAVSAESLIEECVANFVRV